MRPALCEVNNGKMLRTVKHSEPDITHNTPLSLVLAVNFLNI
jgi:hypothetical protein